MKDAVAIAAAVEPLRSQRVPLLVATVVRVEGSSYRRPGARLVATTEGRIAGSVSGGCLERDLLRTGAFRSRNGPKLVRYDSREPDEGAPVLGCGGIVDLLLEHGTAGASDDPLAMLTTAVATNEAVILATVFETTDPEVPLAGRWLLRRGELAEVSHPPLRDAREMLTAIASAGKTVLASERATSLALTTNRGAVGVLIEAILPAPHLFIFGTGADVVPLVTTARSLGWHVTVWAASDAFEGRSQVMLANASVERDLGVVRARIDASHRAMCVVMGHSLARDREALASAMASRAIYVGVLGPRRRTESILADSPDALSDRRLHAPVGLDLGAETPEEIALAIAAEILARLRGATHEALREREYIHT